MAGGLFSAAMALHDANKQTRTEQQQRDDTRWQRAMQAVKAGNASGALAILNEKGQKYSQILPREDGGISLLRADGAVDTVSPDSLFYASTGQVKDPTETEYKKAQAERARAEARRAEGETKEEEATRPSRIAKTTSEAEAEKTRAAGLASAQKHEEELFPLVKQKTQAELDAAKAKSGREQEEYEYGVKQRPFGETAAKVGLGLKVKETEAKVEKARSASNLKPADELKILKQIDVALSNQQGGYEKPVDFDGALRLVTMLSPEQAATTLDDIEAKVDDAIKPEDMPEPAGLGWFGKETKQRGLSAEKAKAAIKQKINVVRAQLAGEGETATGLRSSMPNVPPAPQPRPPPTPPAPMAPTPEPPPQTPAPAMNFGVTTGVPGPMSQPMQVPSKAPTMIPPGPQVRSPQTGPTMNAMAAGEDKTDLKQVLLQNVRMKLMTPEQAATIARQAGIQ